MVTNKSQVKYLRFLSVDEMHEESKKWVSELNFIKVEQLFFDDLLKKTYSLDMLNQLHFNENLAIIENLAHSQKRNNTLIETVEAHRNNIEILMDGIDQIKEEAEYKNEHKDLIVQVSDFYKDYKILKMELFMVIKKIIKSKKPKLP